MEIQNDWWRLYTIKLESGIKMEGRLETKKLHKGTDLDKKNTLKLSVWY